MRTVTNAEELGKAIKAQDYPMLVKSEELLGCIDSLRSLSRIVWIPVVASLGSILVVFGGLAGIMMLTTGVVGAGAAAAIAAAGGGIAIAAVGLDVTVSAVKIGVGGGGVKALKEIRFRNWQKKSDAEGILA